ncbi:MAG TPA: 2-oxoglutarate and iron-dependent oxygenase domain-containing protein [Acetobacteraceae bacterium]|nr:2-oxoglutarate and iron-dependent oxygenase domain-containing protein [Acetobacteraceae bacterium]
MVATVETGNGIRHLAAEGLGARTIAFHEIPMIDLAPFSGTDAAARRAVASALREACVNVGFFYIRNHGVPQALIDETFAQAPRFFGLSLEEKMRIHVSRSVNNSGYTPLLEENTDPSARGDLHEAFDMANEQPEGDPDRSRMPAFFGPNLWPAELPGFEAAMTRYFRAMQDLGRRLFRAFALALDLPEDWFEPMITRPTGVLRLLQYPSQTGEVDEKQIGIGAHSDYECFTILAQDGVPALQVLNGAGEWIAAPPIPGSFVINIGDQMARWTNDLFASTLHRAINRTGRQRNSIPFFFGTNADTEIAALPGCVDPDRPAKYPPVKAGEYVLSRFDATYKYRQPTTT